VRVLSVVGNRPQFIKAAPLSAALRKAGIEETVLHTGQHYDRELSQVFFDELGLAEPIRLELRTSEVEQMWTEIEAWLGDTTLPDWVLVFGDTNSTLAGASAAVDRQIPLAHVEAGLRSGDDSMPEERNRIMVDSWSTLLLCPDERSAETLRGEGAAGKIEVVGDVMYDACLQLAPAARERSTALANFGFDPGRYVLATIHREANVRPDRLARILEGLSRLDEPVLLAAHPRTAAVIKARGLLTAPGWATVTSPRQEQPPAGTTLPGRIRISPPLPYLDFAALASQARVIVTDSGGIQKEAYWYGVPCVTARPSTEWKDTVELGANVLVDDDPDRLVEAVRHAHMPENRPQLYGDGHASEKVAAALLASLGAA
jgi:UDP-GlcNAc3NAcA epimerase